jgi:hypothetical protein
LLFALSPYTIHHLVILHDPIRNQNSTGVISGYVVSRQALTTRIARAEVDKLEKQQLKSKDVQWDMNRGEGGVGGLEEFADKYATTR